MHFASDRGSNTPISPVYKPNPTSIDAPQHEAYTLRLYNMQGALLRELNNIKGNNIVLQRDGLPSGFYYYRFFDKDLPVAMGKIMAQ